MSKKKQKYKKLLFAAITVVITLAIGILLLELALRVYIHFDRGALALTNDSELGWANKAYFSSSKMVSPYDGSEPYRVKISTDKYGFRVWGNPKSQKTKVFVVGDSFTMGMYASDGENYYSVMADTLNIELFTYGCSGYGTLQEYIVIKRHIDEINPDIVILQFCSNDQINNVDSDDYDPIELAFGRPYLKDGKITPPTGKFGAVRSFLCAHSYLVYFITTRSKNILTATSSSKEPEKDIGFATTRKIFSMFKDEIPGEIQLLVFPLSCDNFRSELIRICEDLNIKMITGVDEHIASIESEKKELRAPDGSHFNRRGEKIIGDYLAEKLKEKIAGTK